MTFLEQERPQDHNSEEDKFTGILSSLLWNFLQ